MHKYIAYIYKNRVHQSHIIIRLFNPNTGTEVIENVFLPTPVLNNSLSRLKRTEHSFLPLSWE